MAAPISWAPVILWFFLPETLYAHKIPWVRGGGVFWVWGGEVRIIFSGREDFLTYRMAPCHALSLSKTPYCKAMGPHTGGGVSQLKHLPGGY